MPTPFSFQRGKIRYLFGVYDTVLKHMLLVVCRSWLCVSPWQLTYRHTLWNDVWCSDKWWEIKYRHNVQCHLGQSENWIFCVPLVTPTWNVWRNVLSRICRSIRRHFKHSVDTLIAVFIICGKVVWPHNEIRKDIDRFHH